MKIRASGVYCSSSRYGLELASVYCRMRLRRDGPCFACGGLDQVALILLDGVGLEFPFLCGLRGGIACSLQ